MKSIPWTWHQTKTVGECKETQIKSIPLILHQTCKDRTTIPPEWREWQEQWIKLHPNWEYHCWDDQDNLKLIQGHYPQYLQLYHDLPNAINRVDLCKFLYMHHYGGFYVDMDCKPLKPFDPLCLGKPIVLGEKVFWGTSFVECAVLGSRPREEFWIQVIQTIANRFYHPSASHTLAKTLPALNVIMTTGPIMMRDIVQEVPPGIRDRIEIYPEHFFFSDPTLQHKSKEAFCIHYCHTTWLSGHEKAIAKLQRSSIGHTILLLILLLAIFIIVFLFSYFIYTIIRRTRKQNVV